jgi:transposase
VVGARARAVVADRGYLGLAALAARRHVKLDIKAPPKGTVGFTPLAPLYKVEHAFAHLGRWRRLSRCYEGTETSARAWLEVASVGYLLGRL